MNTQTFSRQEKKEKLLQFIKERRALRKKVKPTLVKTGRKPLAFLVKFRKIQVPRRLVAKMKRMVRKVSRSKKRGVTPEASAEIPKDILLSRQERKKKLLQFIKGKKEKLLETKRRKEEIELKAIAARNLLQKKRRLLQAKASVSRKEKKKKLLQFIREKKSLREKKVKPTFVKIRKKPFYSFLVKFRKISVPRGFVAKIKRRVRKVSLAKKAVITPEAPAEAPKTIPFSRQEKREKLLQFIREKKSLRVKKFEPTFAKKTRKFPLPSLVKIKGVGRGVVAGVKEVVKKAVPAKKEVSAEVAVKAPAAEKPRKIGKFRKAVKPVPRKPAKKKAAVRQIELKVLLRRYGLRIFFFLLLLAWIGEVYIFYSKIYFKKQESEEVAVPEEKKPPEKKGEIKVVMQTQGPEFTEIEIVGERDPFSSELFRTKLLVKRREPIRIIRPIIKPKEPTKKPIVIPPLIPEGEKLSALVSVSKPRVPEIFPPKVTCPLRYRGSLEIAGIEYLFIEGKKPHQALIGDTIEGYHLFNKLGDTIYLSREGNIFQLQREVLLCPLHYRGRLIMDGKEYLFLEGKRTYRVTLGGTAEGYQVIRRIGNILYLLKDDNIFELKEE